MEAKGDSQVIEVKRLLDACPNWTRLSRGRLVNSKVVPDQESEVAKKDIIAKLLLVAKYPTNIVRSAIQAFIADEANQNKDILLILNMLMFNIPCATRRRKTSAPYWTPRLASGLATEITYPITVDLKGEFHLSWYRPPISGPGWNIFGVFDEVAAMFDELEKEYGRRFQEEH